MSMLCPLCNVRARCHNSRRNSLGHVNRLFTCLECGSRFSSLEVITSIRECKNGNPGSDKTGAK